MIAIIKETGVKVDVVCQGICVCSDKRTVVWTDGERTYLQELLDFSKNDIDWEQRRYELAKASIYTSYKIQTSYTGYCGEDDISESAIRIADEIIEKLKEKKL